MKQKIKMRSVVKNSDNNLALESLILDYNKVIIDLTYKMDPNITPNKLTRENFMDTYVSLYKVLNGLMKEHKYNQDRINLYEEINERNKK